MSPIDYSAWDRIEISDDEDIECHPNVDKMSLVRWRQQKIRQERKDRRFGIDRLTAQLAWLDRYATAVRATPLRVFAASSPDAPPPHIVALIREFEGVPDSILPPDALLLNRPPGANNEDAISDAEASALAAAMTAFVAEIESHRKTLNSELERLRKEESMHIDIDTVCRPGFDSKTIISETKGKADAKPVSKAATYTETAEVLNPEGVAAAKYSEIEVKFKNRPDEDTLITSLDVYALAELPPDNFAAAEKFLRENMPLLEQEANLAASEQIMASAFEHGLKAANAALSQQSKIALFHDKKMQQRVKTCTMLQFLRDLSGLNGGPRAFFSKLVDPTVPASVMFKEHCESTINHIRMRSKVNAKKSAGKMHSRINITQAGNLEILRELPIGVRDALLTEDLDLLYAELDKLTKFDSEKFLRKLRETGILRDGDDGELNGDENEDDDGETDSRLVSNADPALQKRLLKELPADFANAIVNGDAETINNLLNSYSEAESQRVLNICREGDFLELMPANTEEELVDDANE